VYPTLEVVVVLVHGAVQVEEVNGAAAHPCHNRHLRLGTTTILS
jgi:hypothetical protein